MRGAFRSRARTWCAPAATLADFEARPGLSGMPLLAPFANRLDETAFYANGKKYNFDLELGNVRGPIPSTGYVNGSKAWQLVEFKADQKSAWVTCKLDFYKIPQFMKQFPFAHTITMTYRVSDGALEVHTRLDNLSTEPMPVVIGYHPIYRAARRQPRRLDGVGRREDALDRDPAAAPDRRDPADREVLQRRSAGDPAQELRAHRRRVHRSRYVTRTAARR